VTDRGHEVGLTGGRPGTSERVTDRRWAVAVGAASAVFTVVVLSLVLHKHANYGLRSFDLAIFDQGVWLLSRGDDPFVTVRGLHLFGDHSSYALFFLAPLYWIWSDVRMLMVVTVVALAACGPLVYAIARREGIRSSLAAGLAVAFLLQPAVWWQAHDVFHPEVLAIPLLLAAYLLAAQRRIGWALAMLALVLTVKEDAPLVVIPLAVYLGWRFRSRLLAAGGVVAGLGMLVLNFGALLPRFSPTGELIYTGRYGRFGDSLPEIAWGLITNPLEVAEEAAANGGIEYLAAVFLPFLVALAAPTLLLVTVPTLLANLLSAHHYQADVRYHYTAYLIPVVALAAVAGMRRLQTLQRARPWMLLTGTLVVAVAGAMITGPWGLGESTPWRGRVGDADLVTEALEVVPADAKVTADSAVLTHMAQRTTAYLFPNPVRRLNWSAPGEPGPPAGDFDWAVVRPDQRQDDDLYRAAYVELIESGDFEIVVENAEVTVLRRLP
jgi:uncharacterized membrane protein